MTGCNVASRDNLIRCIKSCVVRTGMYLRRPASWHTFHELLLLREVGVALFLRFKAFFYLCRGICLFWLFGSFYALLGCILGCVLALLE